MTVALLANLFDIIAVLLIIGLTMMVARRYPAVFLQNWIGAQLFGLILLLIALLPQHLAHPPLVGLMLLAALGKAWCYATVANHAKPGLFPPLRLAIALGCCFLVSGFLGFCRAPMSLVGLLPTLALVGVVVRLGALLTEPNRIFQGTHSRWLGWALIGYGALSIFYPITHVYLPWVSALTGTTLLLVIGLGMIISLLEEHEEALERVSQERVEALTEANRLKDEFLSIVSHELRTPLNAIIGFGSALEDGLAGMLSEEQQILLSKMLRGSDRMSLLVDDLLELARLRSKRFELFPSEEPFQPLVDEAWQLLENAANPKGLTFSTEIRIPGPVTLDRARILQVLVNLLNNAIKFTRPGGTIALRAWLAEQYLVTEIADDGIGIATEDLPKLFQPFQQLDMSLVRQVGGTGLGLSICKGIVEAHGGWITAESPGLGHGATFRFSLPLAGAGSFSN